MRMTASEKKAKAAAEAKRHAAWVAMWEDPRYVRLHAKKDEALRVWNRADFYGYSAERKARCERAVKRLCRAVGKFEDLFLKVHGC